MPWFDNQAEEAVEFYTAIFGNSKTVKIARYEEAGYEVHKEPAGSVMTVAFELDAQVFAALKGGPVFKFGSAACACLGFKRQTVNTKQMLPWILYLSRKRRTITAVEISRVNTLPMGTTLYSQNR